MVSLVFARTSPSRLSVRSPVSPPACSPHVQWQAFSTAPPRTIRSCSCSPPFCLHSSPAPHLSCRLSARRVSIHSTRCAPNSLHSLFRAQHAHRLRRSVDSWCIGNRWRRRTRLRRSDSASSVSPRRFFSAAGSLRSRSRRKRRCSPCRSQNRIWNNQDSYASSQFRKFVGSRMLRRAGGGGSTTRTGTSAARTAIGLLGTVAVRAVAAGTTALGWGARVRRFTGSRTVTTGPFSTARCRRETSPVGWAALPGYRLDTGCTGRTRYRSPVPHSSQGRALRPGESPSRDGASRVAARNLDPIACGGACVSVLGGAVPGLPHIER